jgi:hypothetical protein
LDVRFTVGLGVGGVSERHKAGVSAADNGCDTFVFTTMAGDLANRENTSEEGERSQAVARRPVPHVVLYMQA